MAINLGSAYGEIKIDTSEVRDTERAFKSSMNRMGESFKNFGSALTGVGARLSAGVTAPLLALGGAAIKTAADMETIKVSFTTMLGSAEAAEVALESLYNFTATTPFQFEEVSRAARSLLAFGTTAEELEPTLRALGDVSAGIGAPIAEIAEIYGKARVQGRLFMEDINQLTGRGIPIIGELAKQFDVTESEVRELVSSGQVEFANLEQAFRDLTTEGGKFEGLMEAQSKTVAGLFSTLKDQVSLSLGAIGTALIETFDLRTKLGDAIDVLSDMREELIKFIETEPQLFAIFATLGGAAAALGPLAIVLGQVATGIGALLPIIGGLVSLLTGPFGVALAVAAGLLLAYQENFLGLRDVVDGVAQVFMDAKSTWDETGSIFETMVGFVRDLATEFGLSEETVNALALEAANLFFALEDLAEVASNIWQAFTDNNELFGFVIESLGILAEYFGLSKDEAAAFQFEAATMLLTLQNAARDIIPTIQEKFVELQAAFQAAGDSVRTALAPAIQFLTTDVFPFFQEQIQKIVDFFTEEWPAIAAIGQQVGEMFASDLELLTAGIQTALAIIAAIWGEFGPNLLNAAATYWEAIKVLISGVIDVILGLIRTFLRLAEGDWQAAGEAWAETVGHFIGLIVDLFTLFIEGLLNLFGTGLDDLRAVIVANILGIIDDLNEFGELFFKTGNDLMMGMVDGVNQAVRSLVDSVVGGVGQAIESAKAALGIDSPSRVAAVELGAPLMQGAARGVLSQVAELSEALSTGSRLALSGAAAAPAPINNTYNVTADLRGSTISNDADVESLAERVVNILERRR